jgi:hypothetical protein
MMKQVFEVIQHAEMISIQNGRVVNPASLKNFSSDLLNLPENLLPYEKPETLLLEAQHRINNMTLSDFLDDVQLINWNAIAGMKNEIRLVHPSTRNDPFPTRSAYDCKIEWTSRSDPRVNLTTFTGDEDQALIRLVHLHNGHNWLAIIFCFLYDHT